MASIALSSGVRQALSSIQSTSAQQSVIQNRLATGKKVNSALDNPTSFFTASGLTNRAGDLATLLDDMGQAVKTLEAADKAITALGKLIDNAKSIAKQAQAAPADIAAKGGEVTGTKDIGAATGKAGSFKITVGSSTKTVTLDGTEADADAIKTKITAAGVTGLTATTSAATGKITLSADSASDHAQSLKIELDTTDATASQAVLDSLGFSVGTTAATEATTKRADLGKDLAGIMTQIDDLAKDASYNGINLVKGDNLKVTFNESGKSKLDITGKNLDFGWPEDRLAGHRHERQYRQFAREPQDRDRYAALAIGYLRRQPFGGAEPAGFHQGHDRHPQQRLRPAHPGRSERGRRQAAVAQHPRPARRHGSDPRLAAGSGSSPPVLIMLTV